jgi:hypothetical protein
VSIDPVESEPPYQYVRGNVVNLTDPSGMCAEFGDDACWSEAERLNLRYGIGLEYLGQLSYRQLTAYPDLAAVLAFTLYQNHLVNFTSTTDASRAR